MGLIRKAVLIGAGYVLGARAGTGRYDEIVRTARALAARPEVQDYLSVLRTKTGLGRSSPDVVVVPGAPDDAVVVPPLGSNAFAGKPAGQADLGSPVVQADLGSPVDPASVRRPSSSGSA